MRSSPACWAAFGEVLGREFSDPDYFVVHQMTVDSYAASHPGKPERRTIQAMGLQLMTLQLFIEEDTDISAGPSLHKRMIRRPPPFTWLAPPEFHDRMTVADVLKASSAAEHRTRVRAWAQAIWAAWAPHHPTIRDWVDHSLRT